MRRYVLNLKIFISELREEKQSLILIKTSFEVNALRFSLLFKKYFSTLILYFHNDVFFSPFCGGNFES